MLVARKRVRDVTETPIMHHHTATDCPSQQQWLLRDLLNAYSESSAYCASHRFRPDHEKEDKEQRHTWRQALLEYLQRYNQLTDKSAADVHEGSLERSSARLNSQELFLSVVLEWQRSELPHASALYQEQSSGGGGVESNANNNRVTKEISSCSSSMYSTSDSEPDERNDVHHIKSKQRKLQPVDEISPTSVHNIPGNLTPLRLDYCGHLSSSSIKRIGIYSPRSRQQLLRKYMAKREKRLSQNTVRYRVRKTLANARPRVKGRFVKTEQPLTAALVEAMAPASSKK